MVYDDDSDMMGSPYPPINHNPSNPPKTCGDCQWFDLTWKKDNLCFCLWNGGFHGTYDNPCPDFTRRKQRK